MNTPSGWLTSAATPRFAAPSRTVGVRPPGSGENEEGAEGEKLEAPSAIIEEQEDLEQQLQAASHPLHTLSRPNPI